MEAAKTVVRVYESHMIDLLHNYAVDLISLLDDELLDIFFSKNPRFVALSSHSIMNVKTLQEMIDILVKYLINL